MGTHGRRTEGKATYRHAYRDIEQVKTKSEVVRYGGVGQNEKLRPCNMSKI